MKKLIIVCEEHLKTYGDFLAQLISLQDDKGESIIGIKDGSASALVWTEKDYVSNMAQISSEQYILFIGNSKMIRDKRNFMQEKFSKYGMKYGWLGKQACLFVESVVSADEYDDFYDFATGYQPNTKKLLETKPVSDETTVSVSENCKNVEVTEISKETIVEPEKKFFLAPKALKDTVHDISRNSINAINKLARDINRTANNKKIEDQEYSCLVLLFYLKGLASFVGVEGGQS